MKSTHPPMFSLVMRFGGMLTSFYIPNSSVIRYYFNKLRKFFFLIDSSALKKYIENMFT